MNLVSLSTTNLYSLHDVSGRLTKEDTGSLLEDSLPKFVSFGIMLRFWDPYPFFSCSICFGSVLSISAGFCISVPMPLRSTGPQPLGLLAARLRTSFGIGRFSIAIDTFDLPSIRGLKPSLICNVSGLCYDLSQQCLLFNNGLCISYNF